MTTRLVPGQRRWSMTRDSEGYREYKLTHLVECATTDGPANALRTPGLPLPGSAWVVDGDIDLWVWCRPDATVTPVTNDEPNQFFLVEQIFSNKPLDFRRQRCQDNEIENPLLEPPRISGGSTRYTIEATHDLFGPILNSAWELRRGPEVEFDENRPSFRIEMNVASVDLVSQAVAWIDCVNALPLWGFPPRTVKLSAAPWEKRYYGNCLVYYNLQLEFDIHPRTWDRYLLDEGTMALRGRWTNNNEWELVSLNGIPPNPADPRDFIRVTDRQNNLMRVVLDGAGKPYGPIHSPDIPPPVTPGSTCAAAAAINLNRTYETTIGAGESHFYKVSSRNYPRRIVVRVPSGTLIDNTLNMTVYDGACAVLPAGNLNQGVSLDHQKWILAQSTSNDIVIEVGEIAELGIDYSIQVQGQGPVSQPGTIPVFKYPGVNFLLLGIPIAL